MHALAIVLTRVNGVGRAIEFDRPVALSDAF